MSLEDEEMRELGVWDGEKGLLKPYIRNEIHGRTSGASWKTKGLSVSLSRSRNSIGSQIELRLRLETRGRGFLRSPYDTPIRV